MARLVGLGATAALAAYVGVAWLATASGAAAQTTPSPASDPGGGSAAPASTGDAPSAPEVGVDTHPARPVATGLARLAAATTQPALVMRPKVPRGKASESLQRTGRWVGARGGTIDDPCLSWSGATCIKRALTTFFVSLDQTGRKEGQTRMTVFGNSLIASDRIVDIWRDRFAERFGDAGRGFLLADRMAPYGGRSRTGVGARGWETYNIAQGPFGPWPHGLLGVLHFSSGYARTTWWLKGARRARVFWLDHDRAPPLELTVDDQAPLVVEPTGTGKGRVVTVDVPEGAKALRLKVPRGRAIVYGASFEKAEPGIILDTLGVVASDSTIFLKEDEGLFTQQLSAADPDLVAVLLGGNETKRVAWGKSTAERVRRDLHRFLQRIKRVSPRSSCLVVGPIENVRGKGSSRPWSTRWQLFLINSIMREVALEEGCAWFDLFEAMGGRGQLQRLNARNLLHDDMVHPKGRGLDMPGEMISDALLDHYEATPVVPPPAELQARSSAMIANSEAATPLRHWGATLEATATREAIPVAVMRPKRRDAQKLFDALEAHLIERFGDAGTSLLPVGALEKARFSGAAQLHLWRRQPAFKVTSGRRTLDVMSRNKTATGWAHGVVDVTKAGSWRLERSRSDIIFGRELDRYPGVVIDDLASLPAEVAGAVKHPLVLVPAGASPPLYGGSCLALALPGMADASAGCQSVDVVRAHGGAAAWEARGLLDDGALTEAGVAAAARLLITGLFGAEPSGRKPEHAG
jgi:hypothetical protein